MQHGLHTVLLAAKTIRGSDGALRMYGEMAPTSQESRRVGSLKTEV